MKILTTSAKKITTTLCAMMASTGIVFGQSETENEKFETFFKNHLEEHLQSRPLEATELGDHRFDHLLEDVGVAARSGWTARASETLTSLSETIDYAKLSRDKQIDFEIFKHELTQTVWQAENSHPFEEDPRTYNSYLSGSIYALLAQSTLPKETNIENAIARMAYLPGVIEAARENQTTPPRPILETAIKQNRGVISFYEKGIYALAGDTPQLSALKTAAEPVVARLKDYQKFLEVDLGSRAVENWRLGKEKFSKKLELQLNAGLTADQVLADAEAEFVRVEGDMYVIARQLWSRYSPKRPLPPDDEEGRRATTAPVLEIIGQEHGKPEDLVRDARATVERIKSFIAENDILRLPDPDRCQIIEMPEYERGNSLAYLNSAPPFDPKADTYYAISPPPADWSDKRVKSFLEEYNRHMLQVLTIHEAYPGHYVQLEYSNRSRSLVRKILKSGVFIEGWAVYTEQMMLDQGYGEGDLALRLTQLKYYLRAVGNAILDHKMHCTEMTDEEALHLLSERAFQSDGEARLKIIRAKQTSVQLSTYFVGRMAIYRLRQEIQRELGDKFDLGRFHEAAIDHGSVPVKYLPELVRKRLKQPR
jgi:uncharacterized protein (DUF885 family)